MADSFESDSNQREFEKIDLLFTGNKYQIDLLVSNLKRCKTNIIMKCKGDDLFMKIRNYFKEFKNEKNEHLNDDLTKKICLYIEEINKNKEN